MKNFVISLSSALERRHHIAQVFNEQGIDFEFFDAITPEKACDSAGKIHNRSLYQLKHFHFGGAGYILSLKAIDCLLAEIKMKKNILPIDWVLFHDPIYDNYIKIHQLCPALCIQDKVKNKEITFMSSLEEGRIQFESPKVKLKFLNKIKREIVRLIKQVKNLFFSRVIDFK